MYSSYPYVYYLLILFIHHVLAQTATTTNALGQTVVQAVTTDPARGPQTSILSTIISIPTGPEVQQGPVGQPPDTPSFTFVPSLPTPYAYTTVINGQQTVVGDLFTPTNPSYVSTFIPATGTVLNYQSWLSQYAATSSARPSRHYASFMFSFSFTVLFLIS